MNENSSKHVMPKYDQIDRKTAKMGKKGPNGKSNCRQRGQN